MITFHIITLFPEATRSYLDESILGRAQREKKIAIKYYNPRDFTLNKFRNVDGRPYGGGPGMVLAIEPILSTVKKIKLKKTSKAKTIIFTPGGKQFDNKIAKNYSQKITDLILICGRYEGIDARVKKILKLAFATGSGEARAEVEEISIGPFVLSGGEVPAMVVVDAVARQIPGVLGNEASPEENRVSSHEMYTRPETFEHNGKKYKVPKILISGHHAEIEKWKLKKSPKK
ncbi:MAG: tRNA (guanine-N(1)-)-methyltransferase [Parcubacteria group bacterium GW2011_GWC1_43_11b]|uniref:tRNA (guanine-N(1)-)-methyltransferase n=2 Tax=Candidatus Vogeliibacteriota TaxID=1817922 RepID=A0A1G2QBX5_9BACT|nr:MAG: tRNA (guanine-N(1)-)-methyltransferase [Parcubacteria group bacterium GW2011_GWB1_42_9]KKS89619.1 MAG: tRNA (guanine-N(1)-)-methyltransferase [Parcubacteria group bacterium GW2011_GWC1_43_11b]KKT10070.1 MAG: tRNA (guanine-N(1)-)-methyltransferase [Parcubacteria group bacterium GW2011_GWA1_43_21]OHA58055.1 MAG: tRNA (guanosine(37)-N1)-methyltransferase TrmD [Candidatus Vogelbacteria bacterium RIFOXYB1_FULL_42_16]OHA58325.1 MAG: tRNA (guanosine(37)-N1)-methyltransferase TrmD [Candidatus V